MKKNRYFTYLGLSFVLFCCGAQALDGVTGVTTSGDVSMLTLISQKPSSVQQRSLFQMPEGRLGAQWSLDSDLSLIGELQYGKSRDSVNGRANLQVEALYFDFRHWLAPSHVVQYGLLVHPWDLLSERFWGYRYLGARGPTLGTRYGYLNRSDLGLLTTLGHESWGQASLMVVNGEGAGSEEQGPRKDFHFVLETQPFEGFRDHQRITVALLLTEGGYDNIDAEVSQKERVSLLLGFEQELGWVGSLEVMTTKDPVDGINLLLADKVDLAAQGGQVARGQGASAIVKYRKKTESSASLYEFFVRWDQWNPAVGVAQKGLRSQLLGIGFFPRQNLQISLSWSEVLYETNHAASVRDAADLLLAARLKW